MNTGWRAAKESRRTHAKSKLEKKPPALRPDKKRRTGAKDRNSALRLKGLLPGRGR